MNSLLVRSEVFRDRIEDFGYEYYRFRFANLRRVKSTTERLAAMSWRLWY